MPTAAARQGCSGRCAKVSRMIGLSRIGSVEAMMLCSARRTKAKPSSIRPNWPSRFSIRRRKRKVPAMSRMGIRLEMFSVRMRAAKALPRSAPRTAARAAVDTNPPACRLATRSDAAVELCSSIARPMPAAKPAKRLERRVASHERSASPNVRNMPVFTMYAPQTRSATALALCKRNVYTDQNPRKKGAAGAPIVGLGPCRHDF